MTADPPNNSESSEEPEIITDLSQLSFDFEDATPSNRRSAYGSVTNEAESEELSEEFELLDSLAGQITGDGPPEFYCKPLGQLLGPMSLAELRIMAESGALAEDDLVRYGETGEWKPAGSFSRLAESLHRGSSITAEPVASAPPSTRRLFQTGYKPTGDSFGEDSSSSDLPASTEKSVATVEAPKTPLQPVADAGSRSADSTASPANSPSDATGASEIKSEAETSKDGAPRRKKASKKSAPTKKGGKKSSVRKKAAKKRNDEEDAILNDIFSEVFADDQKTQRSSMPPAATSGNNGPTAPAQSPSTSKTDDAKTPDAPAAQ